MHEYYYFQRLILQVLLPSLRKLFPPSFLVSTIPQTLFIKVFKIIFFAIEFFSKEEKKIFLKYFFRNIKTEI